MPETIEKDTPPSNPRTAGSNFSLRILAAAVILLFFYYAAGVVITMLLSILLAYFLTRPSSCSRECASLERSAP